MIYRVPIPLDSDRLRSRLLEAASALFLERGYAGTSTLAIATRAHVSKRDLYVAFPSKQALLGACLTESAMRVRPPDAAAEAHTPAELAAALDRFGTQLLVTFGRTETLALYRLAIAEAMRAPDLARMVAAASGQAADALAPLLRTAQAAGLLGDAPVPVIAQDFLALLFGPLPLGMLLRADPNPSAAEAADRAQHATAAVLRLYPP
ncbi:MAG: TetR/AcrR family transcriptional regulator [Rhodospirillales bacterium]|nr:TetR/AcrR family transcriptional regulator [Rhodospirillales bacterium]